MFNFLRMGLLGLFLIVIWLPLTVMLIAGPSKPNTENAKPKPNFLADHATLAHYFNDLTLYFNQQFGLRNELIHVYNKIMVFGLHVSPTEQVVFGKHHWLYYAGPKTYAIDHYYRNASPFTVAELEKLTALFKARETWLAAHHIPYWIVIAPNKETIYPEYLPNTLTKINPQSRTEQFVEYARRHSHLQIIDLRDDLLAAKKNHERLYFKSDSHWNDLGAYVGYQAIVTAMAQAGPDIGPRPTFHFIKKKVHSRDLTHLLDLPRKFEETNSFLEDKSACQKTSLDEYQTATHGATAPFSMTCPNHHRVTAVIFRDSFFSALLPFFSWHFDKMTLLWRYDFEQNVVVKEKPDVVIQEFVERALDAMILQA